MKKRICIFLLLATIAAIISPGYVFADNTCAPSMTVVYFGNGVGKGVATYSEAEKGKLSLMSKFNKYLDDPERSQDYLFKLSFNTSINKWDDYIECARQTLGDNWPSLLVAFLLGDTRILNLLPREVVQNFNDFLTNQAIQELLAPSITIKDINDQVSSYKSDIAEGKKVVAVAHSQGNIFANWSYQRLSSNETNYFTIIPVASPESIVRKSFVGHIRFTDDMVIAAVEDIKNRSGLSPPLEANDSDDVGSDWKSHGFSEAYLADTSARNFILSGILTSDILLPTPPIFAQPGTITVTLKWGSNPDVDLHIYEPSGRHVYYSARQGQFGYLDKDDTDGGGPEHYYVSCANLVNYPASIGRYRFGVNYYYGNSPETAVITVKTPNAEATYSKKLTTSRGSNGDNSMIPVADVVISRNPTTGRFDFVIQEK